MADLNTYNTAVRVQTRQVFMAIYTHPFLLLKLDEPAAAPPADDDEWESHTRISTGIGKTGSFNVLRHNAGLYRVYPLKPGRDEPGVNGVEAQRAASANDFADDAPSSLTRAPAPGQKSATPTEGEAQAQAKDAVVLSVGRMSGNDVVVADNAISKHHADFTLLPNGDVTLTDRGSRNGTSVRGRRLAPDVPMEVSFGDPIVMGGLALMLIGAGALWEIIHAQIVATDAS